MLKILAIKWRRLGDTILWTSALEALKQYYPTSSITLAFSAAYASLFEQDQRFSSCIPLTADNWANNRLAKSLRSARFDLVLNFHASRRSYRWARLVKGKQKIIHHHSRSAKRFHSDLQVVNLGVAMSAIERDLNVPRTLGWRGEAPRTHIYVPEMLNTKGRERLQGLSPSTDAPWVLMAVEASRPAKRWDFMKWCDTVRAVRKYARVGVVYEFQDAHVLGELQAAGAHLLHTPTLKDLMAVLSQADLFVGPDSGVKHLACALGVATITLFGPESVGEWHPYVDRKHIAIRKEVSCRDNDPAPEAFSWCGETVCPLGSHACMQLISASEVSKEILHFLDASG